MSKSPVIPPGGGTDSADQSARRLATTICRNVIATLGRPGDLLRITARHVTGDGHRVNVITGPDAASARIAHSFFVTADENGNITAAEPALRKHY
jgi:hypothetical protein